MHGAIIIHPKKGTKYPFPLPHEEVPIIFGIIKLAFSIIGTFFFFFFVFQIWRASCMCNLKVKKMLHNLTRKIFLKWLEISDYAGEWWKQKILAVYNEAIFTGAAPNVSDAYTINGQPGVLYPCSKPGQRFLKFYMYRMLIKFIFYQVLLRLTLLIRMKREEDWRVPVRR